MAAAVPCRQCNEHSQSDPAAGLIASAICSEAAQLCNVENDLYGNSSEQWRAERKTAVRLRSLISLFAVISMLVHAAAIVRHHAVMVRADLQYHSLLADLGHMCGPGAQSQSDDAPSIPRPSSAEFGCPVCAGLVPLFALDAERCHLVPPQKVIQYQTIAAASAIVDALRWLQPPVRAPPTRIS